MFELSLHHPTILVISVFVGFVLASRQLIFGYYTHGSRSSRDLAVSTFSFALLCLYYLLEPSLPVGYLFIPSILLILCIFFVYRAVRHEFNLAANDRSDPVVAALAGVAMIAAGYTLDLAPRVLLYTLLVIYLIAKVAILATRNRCNVPGTTFKGMVAFFILIPAPFITLSIRLLVSPLAVSMYSQCIGGALTSALMLLFYTTINFSVQISASIRNAREITELLDTAVGERTFATELVKIIGHDLRSFLASIRGASQMIADRSDPAAPLIEENAGRAESLLTDLVYWGRSRSASDVAGNTEDIVLSLMLLEAAAADMKSIAESRSIDISISAAPELVRVDAIAVRVVLRNVLSNALKYSPSGSTVHLSAERAGDEVAVRVSDQGPGMSESLQDEIRRGRFVRPEAGYYGDQGTGTGIAIITSVCDAYNWSLDISSREGEGTSVLLHLPRVESE